MTEKPALSHTSNSELPAFVGLCPGEHAGEFYMPLTREEVQARATICPECSERMMVYASQPELARSVLAAYEVGAEDEAFDR